MKTQKIGRPRKVNKKQKINITVSPDVWESAKKLADETGEGLSALIERLLTEEMTLDQHLADEYCSVGKLLSQLKGRPLASPIAFGEDDETLTFGRVKERGGVTQIEFNEIDITGTKAPGTPTRAEATEYKKTLEAKKAASKEPRKTALTRDPVLAMAEEALRRKTRSPNKT